MSVSIVVSSVEITEHENAVGVYNHTQETEYNHVDHPYSITRNSDGLWQLLHTNHEPSLPLADLGIGETPESMNRVSLEVRKEEPVAEEPVVEEAVVEEPVVEEAVVEEPVVEEAVVEEPVEQLVEEPVAEEPVVEEPVEQVEEAVVEEPVERNVSLIKEVDELLKGEEVKESSKKKKKRTCRFCGLRKTRHRDEKTKKPICRKCRS
jgi:hypothetical protein